MKIRYAIALGALGATLAQAQEPQSATAITTQANRAVAAAYDLAQPQDFEDAARGLVARMPEPIIRNAKGDVAWNSERYAFIKGPAPDSVNPSLWRQEQLNNQAGLFKVSEGIWQLRGYDLANMTLVQGKTGWIVIDPLTTAETARATLAFAQQQLGPRPVVAVIYTHSHVDHFGGVRGVVDEADVRAGKIPIIAPDGFMEHAISENVLAGNAMTRRGRYQFGADLAHDPRAGVGSGLGKAVSAGSIGLIEPTDIVRKTGEERVVDGVRIQFMMANGSEAPSEFAFYFPDLKALCLSEVVTANMHNIYTIRGAQMRDALGWSKYINQMIDAFPEAEVAFRSHHWPVWGGERIQRHLANQRDVYRFIHDQAVGLLNQGRKMDDIANATYFPKGLKNDFSTHGYYGTLSHNLRAVYNFYLGYYDGNPATLDPLPVAEASQRYVKAMGGMDAVLRQAKAAFDAGDYRWAAVLGNHAVMAEPDRQAARLQQAATLEQLGYQAESGVWRNAYLMGAQELRQGLKPASPNAQGSELVRSMPLEMVFDYLAVRLNHEKVDGLNLGTQIHFTDTHETYALELSNAVLNHTRGRKLQSPDATLSLTRAAFFKMLLARVPLTQLVEAGEARMEGKPQALAAILGNLDTFNPRFPIVTP
ncbi:alkyl/aryl-sulfatase [Comamonas composti]|uniref:alkyl/aryl-sulfatase n=1 Tax=Comamonas composti TaxID=408558 RepID=UPI00041D481C|nr:alkyl sulfatase dimerization domain-containing protein [Comamonas composti]